LLTIYEVYAKLNPQDPATQKMTNWFDGDKDANPFKRAEKETVSVQIRSILPQTENTWQVEWLETVRNKEGQLQGLPATWRALITVYTAQNDKNISEEQLRQNPLNIFVRDFSWAKVN